MAYCGYLDRHGVFYDCSQQEGPYKHNSWCEERGYDEDQLLVKEGWVKFSDALFNKYIFCYYDGLSVPQIRWLQNHGYKIEDYDLAEKSLRWVVNQIPDFKPTTNEEKMLVAIKLYSEAGAEEIKRLEVENAKLKEMLSRVKSGRVSKLEVENAELRARLNKAIELPPGDRVWYIAEDEEGQESYIISKPTISLTVEELKYEMDKKYFYTREAAEKRLAELNGGKQ